MSTYILMKILESSAGRYDKGIRWLTFGQVDKAYDCLTSLIKKGQKILDIGCGTGALTLRALQKGAQIKGIDLNPEMLEIAQEKVDEAGFSEQAEFLELGAVELDKELAGNYDVIMSGLCFSELSEEEQIFSLKTIKKLLKPGGLLLIGDEVRPRNIFKRIFFWLIRLPLAIITYLVTQTTTHAVKNLPQKVNQAGFAIESVRFNLLENFIELVARKKDSTK